jgi:hypothetical protein
MDENIEILEGEIHIPVVDDIPVKKRVKPEE